MGIFGSFNQGQLTTENMEKLPLTSLADEARISQVLGLRSLESMPTQAAQAFKLACSPKSTLGDFTKVVESDEVLSARIIRIANSVYYRRGEEAKDISRAVATIGLDEIRCLLSAAMLKSLLNSKSSYRNNIWGNSVATGIAARLLSSFTLIPEGEAFLCGILHDAGKLIFIQRLPIEYSKVLELGFRSEKQFHEIELEEFNVTHIEVGKWLAEKWNFPETVRLAISLHHETWPKDPLFKGKKTSSAMLIKCADTIAHAAYLGHPSKLSNFGKNAQMQLTHVGSQLEIELETVQHIKNQVSLKFSEEFSLYSSD